MGRAVLLRWKHGVRRGAPVLGRAAMPGSGVGVVASGDSVFDFSRSLTAGFFVKDGEGLSLGKPCPLASCRSVRGPGFPEAATFGQVRTSSLHHPVPRLSALDVTSDGASRHRVGSCSGPSLSKHLAVVKLYVLGGVLRSVGVGSLPNGGVTHGHLTLSPSAGFHGSAGVRMALPQSATSEPDAAAEQRSPPTERVKRLVDEIAELTLLEVADLTKLLKQKLGMPDMPMGGMMMPMGGMMPGMQAAGAAAGEAPAAEEPPPVEKTAFDVKLEKFEAASKLKVIKEVRAITGLGLKESKELVESAPAVIKKGVPKEEADSIVEKLKAVGAEMVLE